MKYPMMPQSRQMRVDIPKLDGGVNVHDGVSQIEDNQLTDCLNMWWKDGMLRTRPGTYIGGNYRLNTSGNITGHYITNASPTLKFETVHRTDEGGARIETTPLLYTEGAGIVRGVTHVSKPGTAIEGGGLTSMLIPDAGIRDGSNFYPYLLFSSNQTAQGGVYAQLNGDISAEWQQFPTGMYYAPRVVVGGIPAKTEAERGVNGTLFEGYNLLTPTFKCTYTTDGEGVFYDFPHAVTGNVSFAIMTTESGGDCFEFTMMGNDDYQEYFYGGGITVYLYRRKGYCIIEYKNKAADTVPLPNAGTRNNVVITMNRANPPGADIIFKMRFCTWFGGDRSGYNGGTRLFVSGNPNHPNLVHWSDAGNPLYFPENNRAYIGNTSTAVTAFARQAEKLVIFKESEIYSASYVAGASYTTEDFMEGRVPNASAMSAKFPITPIHATVGCDAPDTVQLCNNRLVWATGDRRVYLLTSSNQYSESNVTELSVNIDRMLAEHTPEQLRTAKSCELEGHYMLLVGKQAYLFDTRDSRYIKVSNNSEYRQSARSIPWYVWEFSNIMGNVLDVLEFPDGAYLVKRDTKSAVLLRLGNVVDHDAFPVGIIWGFGIIEIPCRFGTKSFDFGTMEQFKDIRQLYLATAEQREPLRITYVTEHGETECLPLYNDRKNGFVMRRLTPSVRRALRFGLRVESNGGFAVEGAVIKFKL